MTEGREIRALNVMYNSWMWMTLTTLSHVLMALKDMNN